MTTVHCVMSYKSADLSHCESLDCFVFVLVVEIQDMKNQERPTCFLRLIDF